MMISTKGRYALRVMIDLAQHRNGAYIPLMDIAVRQGISEKYLESILAVLSKKGYLQALRGKGGGYRLARSADSYTVGSILRLTEGSLAPVSCLEDGRDPCPRSAECRTIGMWKQLSRIIDDYLDGVTIADLCKDENGADFYVI